MSVILNQYHVVDHNSLLHIMAFIDVILSQSISTQALSPYRMTKVSISKDFNVHYGILIYRPGLMPTKFVFSQYISPFKRPTTTLLIIPSFFTVIIETAKRKVCLHKSVQMLTYTRLSGKRGFCKRILMAQ